MVSLVLASSSPRRKLLLQSVGLALQVKAPEVDETAAPAEAPIPYALRVARAKAAAVDSPLPILAADTVVALDGEILGKPQTPQHAQQMLAQLSGRTHHVHTAVVVRRGAHYDSQVVTTAVRFRYLSASEIETYVATGEPLDKAGAYGIQGHGGALVDQVEGSYTNVVGLPLAETLRLLDLAI